jgi:hypothetical protein
LDGNDTEKHERRRRRRRRSGVTSLEYLFMVSLIVVVAILSIQHVGSVTQGLFQKTATQMPKGGP